MEDGIEHYGEIKKTEQGSFYDIRNEISEKLFNDPSYDVFNAMDEMSSKTDEYLSRLAGSYPETKLWTGGSLGRHEMLPNSDIDLFVIYDSPDYIKKDIRVDGVDKFEVGHIDHEKLQDLLKYSLVDANRFIDGRRVGLNEMSEIENMVLGVSTSDRQLANNISEYFFYRYFDFPHKQTTMGPNLKYSTGSSRDTIFFNMISRMSTGQFPAIRGNGPELLDAMLDVEHRYGIRPPYDTVNLLFTVKNAAISLYDATGDMRNRYVSPISLDAIYNFGRDKFRAWGIMDSRQFIEKYSVARQELEHSVDSLLVKVMSQHPSAMDIEKLLKAKKEDIAKLCLDMIKNDNEYPHTVAALGAWLTLISHPSGEDMDSLAWSLVNKPLDESWGGLMAVVCSEDTPDGTLSALADWLYKNEKGAYLIKLITRNPSSSPETKVKASAYYREKEVVE